MRTLLPRFEPQAPTSGEIKLPTIPPGSAHSSLLEILDSNGAPRARINNLECTLALHPELADRGDPSVLLFKVARVWAGCGNWHHRGTVNTNDLPSTISYTVSGLAQRGIETFDQMSPKQKVDYLWGASFLSRSGVKSFNLAEQSILSDIRIFSGPEISNLLEAYAYAKITCPEAFNVISHRIHQKDLPLTAKDAASILHSMAELRITSPALVNILVSTIQESGTTNKNILSKAAWSCSAIEDCNAKNFVNRALGLLEEEKAHKHHLPSFVTIPLYHAALANNIAPPDWIIEAVRAEVGRQSKTGHHTDLMSAKKGLNGFEQDVLGRLWHLRESGLKISTALPRAGFVPDFELCVPVTSGAARIVLLECDGVQYHFLNAKESDGYTGGDLLRTRILTGLGYRVVHLTSSEWKANKTVPGYLSRRIGMPV